MKAEHRKELQTNTLADFLGRNVRKVRSGGGISWFKVFVAVFVLTVLLGWWWVRSNRAQENAEAWAKLEYDDRKSLQDLINDSTDSKQGQAAGFYIGFGYLWEGIRLLGSGDSKFFKNGIEYIGAAVKTFDQLAEECKDDNERLAEAKYHLAVAYETLAGAIGVMFLDDAKKNFEELTKGELAATAYGMLAKKRLDQYNNPAEFDQMRIFYARFRDQTPVRTGQ